LQLCKAAREFESHQAVFYLLSFFVEKVKVKMKGNPEGGKLHRPSYPPSFFVEKTKVEKRVKPSLSQLSTLVFSLILGYN